MTPTADFLTLPQLAKRAGVHHSTIWRAAKASGVDGQVVPGVSEVFPGVVVRQLGRRWVVSRTEYESSLTNPVPRAVAS